MMKTLGFGLGVMTGPALMAGAIVYSSAPEADAPLHEIAAPSRVAVEDTAQETPTAYKDYGVVWTQL